MILHYQDSRLRSTVSKITALVRNYFLSQRTKLRNLAWIISSVVWRQETFNIVEVPLDTKYAPSITTEGQHSNAIPYSLKGNNNGFVGAKMEL